MRPQLLLLLVLFGCIKPQQPTPVSISPDKETVRKIRELSADASIAEQPEAGELSAILLRARMQLWALANASGDEKALIYAAEASGALTVCTGVRDDECDAAIATQLEKDLKQIERGKDTKTVQEIAPLLRAMQQVSFKDPEGMSALRKLADEDSWRGTAARLFVIGRLAESWSDAAEGSTIRTLTTLRNIAPLACASGKLQDCLSVEVSPWAKEGADAISFAHTALSLLQRLSTEKSDFAKTAQKYSLPEVERRLGALIPLPPPAIQKQLPSSERWTNAALAFPQSVPSDLLPRFYVSLYGGVYRFGIPPMTRIADKRVVLLEDTLGLTFPGKELDKTNLAKSIEAQWMAFQGAMKEINPTYQEQLATVQAVAILADKAATLGELTTLTEALTTAKLTSQLLLVSPKKAPAPEELAFGAALPVVSSPSADTLTVQSDGSYAATINQATQTFLNREALMAQSALFTKAPTIMAPPTTTISQLVSLYDDLRVATKGVWGPIEKAPLSIMTSATK